MLFIHPVRHGYISQAREELMLSLQIDTGSEQIARFSCRERWYSSSLSFDQRLSIQLWASTHLMMRAMIESEVSYNPLDYM